MPLYTVMTQDGLLSAEQRDFIAAELVRIHTAINGAPASFAHSIFLTYPRDRAYVAANRSPVTSILGIIRAGRAPEQKTRLVQALWQMFQDNTGFPIAIFQSRSTKSRPARRWRMGRSCRKSGTRRRHFSVCAARRS
jgi:hypothetical protein